MSSFDSISKTTKLKKGDKSRLVYVNKNNLGCLVSFSAKHKKTVDINKALQYPLSPVPLSIATSDRSRRGTKKSNLLKIIKGKMINENITTIPNTDKVSAYILDSMGFFRTITNIPSTGEDWHSVQ